MPKPSQLFDDPLILKAIQFAETAHTGQKRLSGEPYVQHSLVVAQILSDWQLPPSCVIAGLLHDTVADGAATNEDVAKEFGPEIAELVEGVTKISDIKLHGSTDEQFVENLRRMIVAMSHDLRVVLIKLADRLHNMRTLQYLSQEKQLRIAKETLEIYAPLADRLGMGQVKGELEDLAFPYVYPEDYKWLIEYSAQYFDKAEERMEKITKSLDEALIQEKIPAEVKGRKKHLYSLYKKLLRERYQRDITRISDLVAVRVLVKTIPQCYATLGIIHKYWKPLLNSTSDFIAQPKPNGYQSLHTDVFIEDKVTEFQILTHEMHQEANFGVAAHFQYSEAKSHGMSHEQLKAGKVTANESKLTWVRQLVDLMRDVKDDKELLTNLKMDFFQNRIFVFTPKGDVIDLPQDATPIDFAYHIHTSLGDMATGAKVNGKLVGLNYRLNSGDVCKLTKSKEYKDPNRDWLNFVVTATARKHILKHVRGGKHG